MPAKRLTPFLLLRCLLLSAFASVPLLAHAEQAEDSASADRAPIATATRTPVVESAPTLPKFLFGFGLDFWRSTPEKTAPVAPIAPVAPSEPTAQTPAPVKLVPPSAPAQIILLAPSVARAQPAAPTKPAASASPGAPLPRPVPPAAPIAPIAPIAPASPGAVMSPFAATLPPAAPAPTPALRPPPAAPAVEPLAPVAIAAPLPNGAKPQITPLAPPEPVTPGVPASPLQQAPQPAAALGAIADPPQEVRDDFPRIAGIDLTTPPNDLWQRMRNGFSMPNLDSPLVADRQAWYLNRPELLRTVLNRSRRYLFFIVGELEKRGMPTELALLPMVESSYNPMAYSPARASGLWQFIPSTGKNYRLEQNWWHDQRRDIIASTGAALDYLQNIYEMHGDWHLALASYNWGEAAVARAVAKNQARRLPTDYAHINMPQETRYYVPKLQALKNIIAQPQLFGIKIDPIPNQPYFDTVDKTANMDVSLAAKLAEVPLNEFLALNPSYNRPVMPGSKTSPLVLPADKVQTFLANLEKHEATEKPLSNWSTYTLKKGERLDRVAARFNMSVVRLKQINGIGARSHVRPGNTLLVPGKGMQIADTLPEVNPPTAPEEAGAPRGKGRHGAGKRGGGRGAKAHATARGKPARHAAGNGAKRAGKGAGGKRRNRR